MLKRSLVIAALLVFSSVNSATCNEFYTHGSYPANGAPPSSAAMRAELDLISAGFDKLPSFTGNANKAIVLNGAATGLTTTSGTLTLTGNFAVNGAFATTLTATAGTNVTLPTTGTLATLAGPESFSSKTLVAPILTGSITGTYTLAGSATLTAPVIVSPTITGTTTIGNGATFTSPTITSPTITGTTAIGSGATITAPTITSPTITGTSTIGAGMTITSPTISSPTLSGTPVLPDNVVTISGSADATKKVALEVDGLTTATTRTLTVQDKSGTIALTSEFDYANLAGSSGRMPLPPMFIQGLTFANNATDATNDIDIAAGQCRDATNAHNIILTAITKQSDVAWAVGTNQGGLDAGTVGNSDYYIWAIKRSDTGVTDVLFSLSSTAPTMPTNYDYKRLIGWVKRSGGTIVAFKAYETEGGGLEFSWDVPTLDINLTDTLTTARRTDAVKVPLNFSTIAHLNVRAYDASAGQVTWIYSPDQADTAPGQTAAPLGNAGSNPATDFEPYQLRVRTSATGTIAARSTLATVDSYRVSTIGFSWARRN